MTPGDEGRDDGAGTDTPGSPADGRQEAGSARSGGADDARPDGGTSDTGFGRQAGEFGVGEVPDGYETAETVDEYQTTGQRIVSVFRRDRLALAGALVLVVLVLSALFAPVVAPHDPDATFDKAVEPGEESVDDFDDDGEDETVSHLLGTDSFGHDILSRIIFGARVSLAVAFATVAFAFVVGTSLGVVAGFYGGWVDSVIMRYVDFQWAFPEIVLGVGIIAIMGGVGLLNVILAVGIAFLDDFARIVRGEVLSIREEEYITAARAVGMGDLRIMAREMLPNAVAPIIVQATLMLPLAILAEAGLSFLGLGVSPSTPTWGLLISDGRDFIQRAPHISVMPGLAIMVTVLAFNTVGDGLRDAFDISEEEVN